MCETYGPEGDPHPTNTRNECAENMKKVAHLEPWFGLEQVRIIVQSVLLGLRGGRASILQHNFTHCYFYYCDYFQVNRAVESSILGS